MRRQHFRWQDVVPGETRFGKWTVLAVYPSAITLADVRCDCGTERRLRFSMISQGRSTSCGCVRRPSLVGQKFGKLIVLSRCERPEGSKVASYFWLCRCDCGAEVVASSQILKVGDKKSCGCTQHAHKLVHGLSRQTKNGKAIVPEYSIWTAMIQRCHDPKARNFARYGGRGIRVCDRWRFGEGDMAPVECFLADVGRRPTPEHSLDRIDVNGDYAPGNVRWADKRLQADNKRSTIWLTVFDERMSLGDLSLRVKVPYQRLKYQIRTAGRSPEEALRRLGVRMRPDRDEEAA